MNNSVPIIYRSDHILGLVESELTADLYRHWGATFARLHPRCTTLVVSADMRKHSADFKTAFVKSLLHCGINVVDLGRAPSDLASYGVETVGADGYVCVTGGSQSPEWNGLRWRLNDSPLSLAEQVQELRRGAEESLAFPEQKLAGQYRQFDMTYSWVSWLQSVWFDTPGPPLRILLDPLHGCWSGLARTAMQIVFPQMTIEAIHDQAMEDFDNLVPVSRYPASQETLRKEIERRQADLGIAFDADAGLFTVIDGHGVPLLPEELGWFILRDLLGPALEDEVFLYDVNCSIHVIHEGMRQGGKPVAVRRGDEPFIAAMKENNALIGIGSEGEIYFRGAHGNRIVIFAVCWLIDYLASNGTDLATWRKSFPQFYTTSEIRTPAAPMDRIAARLSEAWSLPPEETIEGFRFRVQGARVNVRAIPDFSQIGFHFEADNRPLLHQIVSRTATALEGLEQIGFFLNEQYAAQTSKRFYFDD